MKISVFVFLMLVFVLASCETKQTPAEKLEKAEALAIKNAIADRDLTQYEQGAVFTCRTRFRNGNEKDHLAGEKKVRDFIWRHWTEKKRGYVILNCPGTDTTITTHYFIEPNEAGAWRIVRSSISQTSDDRIVPREDNIDLVERVENQTDEDWTLLLKTASGEIVEKLPLY